jgi:hypothetical protein
MRRINIKTFIGTALLVSFLVACSKILDEKPRSIIEPDFFKTQLGVLGGVTAAYNHLRNIYGQAYYYGFCETGTDEYTWGQSADANFLDADEDTPGLTTNQTDRSDVLWGATFPNINTCSGVIQFGSSAGVSNALIAEARFFRAFDYFQLVQVFGGVPLDLGGGVLKFNTTPIRTSTRNTVPEVYTQCIFPDLDTAIMYLPVNPRVTGGVTKTVAQLFLAKAYLTYAWWLQNPNSIPTYPVCNRTDPNGQSAQWYYQQAYNVAVAAIENPGPYKLQPTFYDVNNGANDYNMECMLYSDHTQSSALYNVSSLTYGSGAAPDNFAGWMGQWNYTTIRSGTTPTWSSVISSVQRVSVQSLGRPWTRMAPPIDVFINTFADKTNDSRYDGTFTTVYRANWPLGGLKNAFVYNGNNIQKLPGDSILTFLPADPADSIDYSNSVYKSNVGAGVLPNYGSFVVSPYGISRIMYPGLWKLGEYRTDNGTGVGNPNAGSTRPFNIAKFSELFFIAAEAAVQGASTQAVTGTYANDGTAYGLINIIRARAGMWKWSNGGNVALVQNNSAAMIAATPATIDINYILAERSREYFGEGYRWFDLVRTQTWSQIATTYRICGKTWGDHNMVTYTRTIDPHLYLRPIPIGQLNGMEETDTLKATYQNPGY